MKNKFFTRYEINKENKLYFNGFDTGITFNDDYFYKNGKHIDLYVEDNRVYKQNKLVPFISWLKISTPLNLYLDSESKIFGLDESAESTFQELLKSVG